MRHEFLCPYCAARLRIRDRSYAGRTINCPDCRGAVAVISGPDGVLTGITADVAAEKTPGLARASAQSPGDRRRKRRFLIGGLAGLLLTCAVISILRPWGASLSPETGPAARPAQPQSPEDAPEIVAPAGMPAAQPAVAARLSQLGAWIEAWRVANGEFPSSPREAGSLPVDRRLGWLAALAAEQEHAAGAPQWDRAYDDPLNDRFVRQRFESFQNPAIATLVSPDGYPATHFAGVAGVGADAASLRKDHRRAGLFGDERVTTVEDVRDGLSQTMMVAGVRSRIGAWSAAGTGSVRPFSQEPYINGPDGFGGGAPDRMPVLMADGSLRTISSDTDPLIVRRMAAMADGFPLDPSIPGEPGIPPPSAPAKDGPPLIAADPAAPPDTPAAPMDETAAHPIDVPIAPDEFAFDVEAALAQRVLRFSQPQPVPAIVLLRQIEELLGVPIDRSRVLASDAAPRLETLVSLELTDTTVGAVLAEVLARIDLDYTSGPQGIELQ